MDPDDFRERIDLDRPNAARAYDWALGGTANWAIDRHYGEQALKAYPLLRVAARANRDFLGRAVRFCVEQGVTQFLDLGSGVPTMGNVHEVADKVDDTSRCVYVDFEPVAVAYARVLLENEGDPKRHAVVHADLCDAEDVWEAAIETGVLVPDQPVGLLSVAVLHFIPDSAGVRDAIRAYRDRLPPGSLYVLSHLSSSGVGDEVQKQLGNLLDVTRRSPTPNVLRTRAAIAAFFGDFDLVEPGLVPVGLWRPDDLSDPGAEIKTAIGGVARKPAELRL